MTKSSILGSTLVLCVTFCSPAQADTYWWTNDQGVTQIGEVVPPEFAGRVTKHLDNKGRVVRSPRPEAEQKQDTEAKIAARKAVEEQRRQDKSLLLSYSNVQEIDGQRDKNLEPITAHIKGIRLRQQAVQERLDGFNKEAEGQHASNPSLQADIDNAKKDLAVLQQELDATNEEAENIKAKYEERKIRYRELTGGKK